MDYDEIKPLPVNTQQQPELAKDTKPWSRFAQNNYQPPGQPGEPAYRLKHSWLSRDKGPPFSIG